MARGKRTKNKDKKGHSPFFSSGFVLDTVLLKLTDVACAYSSANNSTAQ
jgi:hypothetical protein